MSLMKSFLEKKAAWSRHMLPSRIGGARPVPKDPEWVPRLREIAAEVGELNCSTEGEFLAIGDKLQGFHHSTQQISNLSTSIAVALSGEEIANAMDGLGSIARRVQHLQDEALRNGSSLKQVLEQLGQTRKHLDRFDNVVRELRMLCVSIRIESARLGERDLGFSALADDVKRLVLDIEARCGKLLNSMEDLDRKLRETLGRTLEIEAVQKEEARTILESALSSLDLLKERNRLSSATAELIASRYDAVSRGIGKIILSLQFHDITRQQIEHVTESLLPIAAMRSQSEQAGSMPHATDDSISGRLQDGTAQDRDNGRGEVGHDGPEHLLVIRDVCGLQAAHLRHARDELVSAVRRIIDNLRDIVSHISGILNETHKVAGNSGYGQHSFLDEIRAGFSSLSSSLSQYAESNRELSRVVTSVGGAMGEMMAFAGGIEEIGMNIKLIALNAIVKACHMDEQGASLGVLAEGVHRLSVDTCRETGAVCDCLRSINDMTAALLGKTGAREEKEADVALMDRDQLALFDTLQTVSDTTLSNLAGIDGQGLSLSQDIERTVAAVTVHHRVKEVLDGVVEELTEIGRRIGLLIPEGAHLTGAEHLKAMEVSYTMQAEREVHESLAGAHARRQTAPLPEGPAASHEEASEETLEGKDDDDLGDNVELF